VQFNNKKMNRGLEQTSLQKRFTGGQQLHKKFSVSLSTRKLQIGTTMRSFTPTGAIIIVGHQVLARMKRNQNTRAAGEIADGAAAGDKCYL
jgi:DNA integrity scanning protein DisA with diadenylate cyclase activity